MQYDKRPLLYGAGVESIPVDESDDIQRVVAAMKIILARTQSQSGQFRADVHVKTHGYAEGELRVLSNLPEELAQGPFERAACYRAVVRFSNAASQTQADALPDGRGMGIKVFGVTGEMMSVEDQSGPTQDFLMINHPVFFSRNVKDFLRVEHLLAEAKNGPLATAQQALTGSDWNPLNWHWREMLTLASIIGQLPTHPASNTYSSASPIRFGKYIAKYRALPAGNRVDSYVDLIKRLGTQTDAMRLALEETLRTQEVLFEFQVQLRTSEQAMPIEDPTVEWPENESRIERSRICCFRDSKWNQCDIRRIIKTSRLTCGTRSPHIGRWEASTASAAWPTRSHLHGVANKQLRHRNRLSDPTKAIVNQFPEQHLITERATVVKRGVKRRQQALLSGRNEWFRSRELNLTWSQ